MKESRPPGIPNICSGKNWAGSDTIFLPATERVSPNAKKGSSTSVGIGNLGIMAFTAFVGFISRDSTPLAADAGGLLGRSPVGVTEHFDGGIRGSRDKGAGFAPVAGGYPSLL